MKRISQKQSLSPEQKYTVKDFNLEFPDDDSCLEYIAEQRWPDGRATCGSDKCKRKVRKHHRVSGRTAYACDHCGNHIYPLAGTIFQKSTTSLYSWFYAMYLMSSTRCGISAKQLQREIGVTYKTAWRMFKQIRMLLAEDNKLFGAVEMDETYIGGKRKYGTGRPMRGDKTMTPVAGIVERKGRVVVKAIPDVKGSTLLGMVREYVMPSTMIYTDELKGYEGIKHMPNMGYKHRRIKHSAKVYVRGDIHTNGIEGFWSLVKRGVGGVYHAVSAKMLQSYLDEYSFRYNHRFTPKPMFTLILQQVSGKALPQPCEVADGIQSLKSVEV